ncbi:MAG: efflux RND transporter periplasmic adaptor subunit, partial [Planctomycetes bacterium]|nr:efflux RND transporter periplasmic adaptor subunit [Planctomycetota bacterium]
FDGYVVKRWVDPGALIEAADRPLLTVTRSDKVRVWLDVPMSKVAQLQCGDRAVLDRINVLAGETFEGVVSRFSPTLDENSRLMRVEIDLPNPEGRLRPGYYGYLTVFLEEQSQAPVIPSSALLSDGKEQFVYVVKNDTAHKQPVVAGYNDGSIVGIASGLRGGEQVVRAGAGQIHDGQPCTPVLAAK